MMAPKKFDVFLSFRGEDTRDGFTSHLHAALKRRSLLVFIDNNLVRGDEISPTLLQAIEASKTSVVVFSQNYASSKWCLDELVKIMECRRLNGQVVIPVFYNVDPSHARHQTGKYFDAFSEPERLMFEGKTDRLQSWRAALKEAANLVGWDSGVIRSESTLIEHIVEDIVKKLCKSSSSYNDGLVGIDLKVEQISQLLKLDSTDVRILGMWGMGGIGKTTLARVVFDRIFTQFDCCYFLANVREQLKSNTISSLRDKLFSKLLEGENLGEHLQSLRLDHIKDKISLRKVLIVLDDGDNFLQLQDLLVGQHGSFGQGSIIIITSRDKHVLRNVLADAIYEVKGLNECDSLKLFSMNAFEKSHPMSDFRGLSNRVVSHSNGNPLALKVSGSDLFDKSKEDWHIALNRFETFPHLDIYNVLKSSYDGLDDEEKIIFLDIAFFFKGKDVNYVSQVLHGYSSVDLSIKILVDKSLLSICKNGLEMHDVIQEMAWKIVHEECKEPGKRSRLRDSKDIHNILIKNKGTETIEGITLDIAKSKELCLKPDVFARMEHLRILEFYASKLAEASGKISLPQGLVFLSDQLRCLHWHGFPLKSLPMSFRAENLVELKLPYSNITKLRIGIQELVNLKILDLQYSKFVTRIPDLSMARNVVEINLTDCESLVELHSSVQYLMKLKFLCLYACKNLKTLPSRIDSQYLEYLDLSECSNAKICPEILGSLLQLRLRNSGIEQLPQSIHHLTLLKDFDLGYCSRLKVVLDFPRNITNLDLSGTAITELPLSVMQLCSLVELNVNCENLASLPTRICTLSRLQTLDLKYCKSLHSLPELPSSLLRLRADDCKSLKTFSSRRNRSNWPGHYSFCFTNCFELDYEARKNISSFARTTFSISCKKYEFQDTAMFLAPTKEMPSWISSKDVGSSICINIPKQVGSNKATRMTFCVIFSMNDPFGLFKSRKVWRKKGKMCREVRDIKCGCKVEVDGQTFYTLECKVCDVRLVPSYHMLLWNPSRIDTLTIMELLRWHDFKLELSFRFDVTYGLTSCNVEKCGVCWTNPWNLF